MSAKNISLIFTFFILIMFYQNCGSQFESISNSNISKNQYLAQPDQESSPTLEAEEPMVAIDVSTPELAKPTLAITSQEVLQIQEDSVKISWTTTNYSQGHIEFGITDKFGTSSEKEESFKYKEHNQILSGLDSETKYFFRVHATDELGNSFVSVTKYFTTLKKEENIGPITIGDKKYLFFGGFENNEGQYASSTFKNYWGVRWSALGNYGKFTSENDKAYQGSSMLVRYPGKFLVSSLRISYATDFKKLNIGLKTEVYLRYYVKFHPGWEWVISGKFPGLAGYHSVSGGDPVNGRNGWSQRWGWYYSDAPVAQRKKGVPIIYSYIYAKGKDIKTSKYGFKFRLHDPNTKKEMIYPVGEWVCLEQHVKLNDVGKPNGVIRAWMNGKKGLDYNDITYRTVENEETMVGQMLFSTFYGGGGNIYAPTKDTYASYDNFVISENRIGCDK